MSKTSEEKKLGDFYKSLSDIRESIFGKNSAIAYKVFETETIPDLERKLISLDGGIQKQQSAYRQAEQRADFYFKRAARIKKESLIEQNADLKVKMESSADKSEDLGKRLRLFYYFTYLKEYITLEDEVKEEKKSN